MSDLESLSLLLTNSAKLRTQLAQAADLPIASLHEVCDRVESQLKEALQQLVSAKSWVDNFKSLVQDFPNHLADHLQSQEAELRHQSASLEEALGETETRLVEQMETGRSGIEELVTSHLDQVTETVNDVVGDIQERAEALFERMKDLRSTAEDLGTELLKEALPDGVVEGAEKFLSGMDTLKKIGLNEMKNITDAVGGVQEKTRALTDLVDDVKPILDLAEKIL